MNPNATPRSAQHCSTSVSSPLPLTQAGSSTAHATMTAIAGTSASVSQPSSGADAGRVGSSSRQRLREVLVAGGGRRSGSRTRPARGGRRGVCWRCGLGGGLVGGPARTRAWSSSTTTVPIPRVRSVASGRTKDGSCDDVTTIAVIPRRSRLTPVTSASASGVRPSASTAASSWRILSRWRAPRSAGRTVSRWALDGQPTARFSPSALSAIDAAARTATSVVESSPSPGLGRRVEVQEDPRVGRLLEVELLDLDLAQSARSSRQWMRFIESPGA